jgi:hypothetical protein
MPVLMFFCPESGYTRLSKKAAYAFSQKKHAGAARARLFCEFFISGSEGTQVYLSALPASLHAIVYPA